MSLESNPMLIIEMLEVIKKSAVECISCPMYDNCHSTDYNKLFPIYWYIPEV